MIETYKKQTSEFGAPNKKIRLPPSLVDLCIKLLIRSFFSLSFYLAAKYLLSVSHHFSRIEGQCNSDGLSHAQKTRIFDSLANWVLVQRNSLYIRMKMQREKREVSLVFVRLS